MLSLPGQPCSGTPRGGPPLPFLILSSYLWKWGQVLMTDNPGDIVLPRVTPVPQCGLPHLTAQGLSILLPELTHGHPPLSLFF